MGVVFVSGVGIECGVGLVTLRNELNEETATSGDCGDRRDAAGPGIMIVINFDVSYRMRE